LLRKVATWRLKRKSEDNFNMDLMDGRWVELAQVHIPWWALVLVASDFWVLLPESYRANCLYVMSHIKVKSLWLIKHHTKKTGSGGIAPCFLNLGTRRRSVVSFKIWLLYAQGKNLQYQLDRRLHLPQSWCGHDGEETKISHCACQELNPHPVHSLVTINALLWISCLLLFVVYFLLKMQILGFVEWIALYYSFVIKNWDHALVDSWLIISTFQPQQFVAQMVGWLVNN